MSELGGSEPPALKFKNEGNTLFTEKKYQAAYDKYTLSLKEDASNAVVYANRAACSQNLRKFLDALADSEKATQLDPTYAKAWARLAAAQSATGEHEKSVSSWKKALSVLPQENLTAAEQKQKTSYEAELSAAERKTEKPMGPTQFGVVRMKPEDAPWMRATAMEAELLANGETRQSSASVLIGAWQLWQHGMLTMEKHAWFRARDPQATEGRGQTGVLACLCNAVVRDERIFHMDRPDWTDRFNSQLQAEIKSSYGWGDMAPQQVMDEVLQRQREQGWGAIRPAIVSTISGWIMRGFIEQKVKENFDGGVAYIGRALEVLRWGLETWRDVPEDDKGPFFCPTFVHGVHALYVEVYIRACNFKPRKYPMETLLKEAEELLHTDVRGDSLFGGSDPGFEWSFVRYPKATAWATIGFSLTRKTEKMIADGSPDRPIAENFYRMGEVFGLAAEQLPKDDEKCLWYLNLSFQNYVNCSCPLRVTLPVMQRIGEAYPKVKRIWEHDSKFRQDQIMYTGVLKAEDKCRAGLAAGRFTMDTMFNRSTLGL